MWICDYDEKEITPPGLRCRNLASFPPYPEIKVPGAGFGLSIGRGLAIGNESYRRVKNPPLTIAKRMEYRQLVEYQKISEALRSNLSIGLK